MQRLINSLPLLSILLVLVTFIYFAVVQWQDFNQERESAAVAERQNAAATQTSAAALPKQKPVRNLASFKLFGDANAVKPVLVEKEPENLPETRLNLTLRGVSASSQSPNKTDEYSNNALIEDARRETQLYRVGDSIAGSATISAIYSDRVVISRNGRKENLYFPEVSKGGGNLIAANLPSNNSSELGDGSQSDYVYGDISEQEEDQYDYDQEEEGESSNLAPRVSPQRTQSIKDRLDAIRNRIRADRNQ